MRKVSLQGKWLGSSGSVAKVAELNKGDKDAYSGIVSPRISESEKAQEGSIAKRG